MNRALNVNEIFYSLQGEGFHTGVPAVFIRLSGCNLKCDFCDTDHSGSRRMTVAEILDEVTKYPARHIVLTGGEPTLQSLNDLLESLSHLGYYSQIETNGSIDIPESDLDIINWITLSPKDAPIKIRRFDELKVVYQGQDMSRYEEMAKAAKVASLQPCDYGVEEKNRNSIQAAVEYIKANPGWRLSLQTHKLIGIR